MCRRSKEGGGQVSTLHDAVFCQHSGKSDGRRAPRPRRFIPGSLWLNWERLEASPLHPLPLISHARNLILACVFVTPVRSAIF